MANRMQDDREELAERIARITPRDGVVDALTSLRFRRASAPSSLGHGVSFPALCVIAQGSKEVHLGDQQYRYDPAHYLIVTAAMPIASQITEASPDKPLLSVLIRLDPMLVGSVMVEAGYPAPRADSSISAMAVSPLDEHMLDAMLRLVKLMDSPGDARFLMPLVTREILYRLLMGEQGDRLRQTAALGGQTHRIAEAIERLRRDFDQPLRIEEMARDLGMSVSGFHHHFKAVTAMSPLQFQKHLRLQEARRLMLGEDCDATRAGFRVGYDDASHFNREYKRLFGAPPLRDVERLREATLVNSGL